MRICYVQKFGSEGVDPDNFIGHILIIKTKNHLDDDLELVAKLKKNNFRITMIYTNQFWKPNYEPSATKEDFLPQITNIVYFENLSSAIKTLFEFEVQRRNIFVIDNIQVLTDIYRHLYDVSIYTRAQLLLEMNKLKYQVQPLTRSRSDLDFLPVTINCADYPQFCLKLHEFLPLLPERSLCFSAFGKYREEYNFTNILKAFNIFLKKYKENNKTPVFMIFAGRYNEKNQLDRAYCHGLAKLVKYGPYTNNIVLLANVPNPQKKAILRSSFAFLYFNKSEDPSDDVNLALQLGTPLLGVNKGYLDAVLKKDTRMGQTATAGVNNISRIMLSVTAAPEYNKCRKYSRKSYLKYFSESSKALRSIQNPEIEKFQELRLYNWETDHKGKFKIYCPRKPKLTIDNQQKKKLKDSSKPCYKLPSPNPAVKPKTYTDRKQQENINSNKSSFKKVSTNGPRANTTISNIWKVEPGNKTMMSKPTLSKDPKITTPILATKNITHINIKKNTATFPVDSLKNWAKLSSSKDTDYLKSLQSTKMSNDSIKDWSKFCSSKGNTSLSRDKSTKTTLSADSINDWTTFCASESIASFKPAKSTKTTLPTNSMKNWPKFASSENTVSFKQSKSTKTILAPDSIKNWTTFSTPKDTAAFGPAKSTKALRTNSIKNMETKTVSSMSEKKPYKNGTDTLKKVEETKSVKSFKTQPVDSNTSKNLENFFKEYDSIKPLKLHKMALPSASSCKIPEEPIKSPSIHGDQPDTLPFLIDFGSIKVPGSSKDVFAAKSVEMKKLSLKYISSLLRPAFPDESSYEPKKPVTIKKISVTSFSDEQKTKPRPKKPVQLPKIASPLNSKKSYTKFGISQGSRAPIASRSPHAQWKLKSVSSLKSSKITATESTKKPEAAQIPANKKSPIPKLNDPNPINEESGTHGSGSDNKLSEASKIVQRTPGSSQNLLLNLKELQLAELQMTETFGRTRSLQSIASNSSISSLCVQLSQTSIGSIYPANSHGIPQELEIKKKNSALGRCQDPDLAKPGCSKWQD